MPKKHEPGSGGAKLSISLTVEAAEDLRTLAEAEGLTLAEMARRSFGLYKFYRSLNPDEELCVRNKSTTEIGRVAILNV
jgi:hypothetical protein